MDSVCLGSKSSFLYSEILKPGVKQKSSTIFILFFILIFFILTIPANAVLLKQLGSDLDGEAIDNESGFSVSLSADGSRVAIGAYLNDGNGTDSGHTRVYEYSGGNWIQLGSDIDGEASLDHSGFSVSLSADGNRVAIGAYLNDGIDNNASGHVRVYQYNGSHWIQVGSDIDGEASFDQSGSSVSLNENGSRVAIGAFYNVGNDTGLATGHVRIYEYNGSSWIQMGSDIDGDAFFDAFGWSVSLNAEGSRVAIGAAQRDQVKIYDYNGSNWVQLGSDINGVITSSFGHVVSLSADGSKVAIGAPYYNGSAENSGQVKIYDYNGSSWMQLGSDIVGDAAEDWLGWSLSLNDYGNRVAIGAPGDDGNGDNSGHVRIYDYDGSSWNQLGSDIDGETLNDKSGQSVSLSSDGNRVAIGAPENDGNGFRSGHTRIYEIYFPCGNTITPLTQMKWWSISRPCGTLSNPTIAELFADTPTGAGLGTYGDENDWVMWKLNGTNPDGSENYTMITDTSEVMKSGVGYWIITSTAGVNWDPGSIAESADPTGISWNVATTGTVTSGSLGITDTDVEKFLVMNPVTDGALTLIQETQLALIGNPFTKRITWSNVYFSNDGANYTAIDSIDSGVQPIAYVSDPDSTSGQPYRAISSVVGFTDIIEPNQAFWIQMIDGDTLSHSNKKIALPLEY